MPDAVAQLGPLDDEARSLTHLRSLVYRPAHGAALVQRPSDYGLVPVKPAPIDCYLKARGSDPPRTWVSGLASKLCDAGGDAVVDAARPWFCASVRTLLSDPKARDHRMGEYFAAWLRECHPDIHHNIDASEPGLLRDLKHVSSLDRSKRYRLADIRIPDAKDAFAELCQFGASPKLHPPNDSE